MLAVYSDLKVGHGWLTFEIEGDPDDFIRAQCKQGLTAGLRRGGVVRSLCVLIRNHPGSDRHIDMKIDPFAFIRQLLVRAVSSLAAALHFIMSIPTQTGHGLTRGNSLGPLALNPSL